MSTDAKLGMVLGMGLLIAVAVVFFGPETSSANSPEESPNATKPQNPPRRSSSDRPSRPVGALPSRVSDAR